MSIERYKMITSSYLHIKHTSKIRVIILICLSWLLPFISWIPVILIYRITGKMNKQNTCSMPDDKYLILFLCIIIYHIPLVCMVVFYTKLIIHIKKSSLNNLECDSPYLTKSRKKFKNSLFPTANKNSRNCDHSTNYDNIRHPELSIKKSNSSNFAGLNSFDFETQSASKISFLNFFAKFTNCSQCCYQRHQNSTKSLNKNSSKSVKYFPDDENNKSLNIKRKVVLSTMRRELKEPESQCLNSRKSSCILKFDQDSTNSTLIRCKNQNNSMNNFIEYHDIISRKDPQALVKQNSNPTVKQNSYYEVTNYQNLRLKRNRKAARMLGLLIASFTICWLPYTIIYPFCQFYKTVLPNWFVSIVWWMGYINSTINPFLYVYSNKNIR